MTEKQIQTFCEELGRELRSCWRAARHEKTREPLRLSELAGRADTTENTLRTLFRGGVKQMDLRTMLRVCAALKINHLSDLIVRIENRMESARDESVRV